MMNIHNVTKFSITRRTEDDAELTLDDYIDKSHVDKSHALQVKTKHTCVLVYSSLPLSRDVTGSHL